MRGDCDDDVEKEWNEGSGTRLRVECVDKGGLRKIEVATRVRVSKWNGKEVRYERM